MKEITCPYDLNQFLLGEPVFENPFTEEACFYEDCYRCFSTAIANRDRQLKASITDNITNKIKSEIEEMDFDFGDFYDHTRTIREMVLKVIDKCKSESEGKN